MHKVVFSQICADLEHEPERWTVRLCDPAGDIIWRNKMQREHYVPVGYVPAETLSWEHCRAHFDPAELEKVELVTAAAFVTQQPVKETIRFSMAGRPMAEECTYLAAFGHKWRGVVAIHCRTCAGPCALKSQF